MKVIEDVIEGAESEFDMLSLSKNQITLIHDALILNIGRHAQNAFQGGINSENLRAMLDVLDELHIYLKDEIDNKVASNEIEAQKNREGGFKN